VKHVMLDLETLATSHDACIIQIAAVRFDLKTGKTGAELNIMINPLDSVEHGRVINHETLKWWNKQNASVRALIPLAFTEGLSLKTALTKLSSFVGAERGSKVWGNGVLFDNALIRNAWRSAGLESEPWGYRADMDVRTLVMLGHEGGVQKTKTVFEGVKHNALDDCRNQIKYCSQIFNDLRKAQLEEPCE